MKRVVVKAPAKINLALNVLGLNEKNYHLLDMIMQAVNIYERVEIEKSSGYGLYMPGCPVQKDDNNTVTKAAKLFFTELGLLAGARITVIKKVPVRAGLAGGSADAAATLVGLNELYNAKLSLKELCTLGAAIGSDVPFAISGGTMRATGTGNILTPVTPLDNCYFTICMPKGVGNSTPEIYKKFDELYYADNAPMPWTADINMCINAIENQNLQQLGQNMCNALEPAGADRRTAMLKNCLDNNNAITSIMTGSGAAVFGLFEKKADAEKAASDADIYCSSVFVAKPDRQGARLVSAI